jgi:hypothetical protein
MFKCTNKKVIKQKSIFMASSYQFSSWIFEQHVNNVIIYSKVKGMILRLAKRTHLRLGFKAITC